MLAFLIVSGIIVSSVLNATIKGWVYEHIIEPEMEELKEGEEESGSLFFTAVGLVLLNNLIPFTLGALVGLYAIM